jgi:internalin A
MAKSSKKLYIVDQIENAIQNKITDLNLSYSQESVIGEMGATLGNFFGLNTYTSKERIIYNIPDEIGKLKNLSSLNVSKNQVKNISPEIGNLHNLKTLDLSHNNISDLPDEIGDLTKLTELNLSNNNLSQLPPALWKLNNLTILDLSSNHIKNLPSEIKNLTNLKIINLENNKLTLVPSEVIELVNLEKFLISHNQLTDLPSIDGKQTKLTTLDISHNNLSNLSPLLKSMVSLNQLDASHNKIKTLPLEIEHLSNLLSLNLSHNKISSIPTNIKKLTRLNYLFLSNNSIRNIPSEVEELQNLLLLRIENNLIEKLPVEICNLKKLIVLNMNNNLIPIPPEILKNINEPKIILDYYRSITGEGTKSINEVKLIIVGQGSVGKTSIANRILGEPFQKSQSKTDGISIKNWEVNSNNNEKIKINLWDFGGQEIMHATHQFFLTKRSLYLLILNARLTQEENRVDYWLKIIQSFGGESPVLVIGNQTDQHPLDIDRIGLSKKYPNIVGFIETSAATGDGILQLKSLIIDKVVSLPHIHDLIPKNWFLVKNKLEVLREERDFILYDSYIELCDEYEIHENISKNTLISFLHDLGVVLHFQDDPRLEALGILNPQWVTNGVYKILNSPTLFQNKGVLTVSMLDEILNLPEYPRGKRLFIVDMMKKFELCYDIASDKTFLVPDLLPKDEPVTDERENALAFQYHYTVLPSSVITRFIVRMNEFVQEKVWRTGVVLKDGGSTALVKADTEDRKVFIWVSGDEHKRHDFLSKIRGQFDAIHKTISKLEVKEMVPVPNHPEVDPVDYDLLLQMEHNNVEAYPVLSQGRMIVVNVREMLNGVARESDRQRGNVTQIYVGRDINADNLIVGNENQATSGAKEKKTKRKS